MNLSYNNRFIWCFSAVPTIWKRDSEKIDSAKNNGYDIKVIWQSDWENCQDKNKYIEDILC